MFLRKFLFVVIAASFLGQGNLESKTFWLNYRRTQLRNIKPVIRSLTTELQGLTTRPDHTYLITGLQIIDNLITESHRKTHLTVQCNPDYVQKVLKSTLKMINAQGLPGSLERLALSTYLAYYFLKLLRHRYNQDKYTSSITELDKSATLDAIIRIDHERLERLINHVKTIEPLPHDLKDIFGYLESASQAMTDQEIWA